MTIEWDPTLRSRRIPPRDTPLLNTARRENAGVSRRTLYVLTMFPLKQLDEGIRSRRLFTLARRGRRCRRNCARYTGDYLGTLVLAIITVLSRNPRGIREILIATSSDLATS